VEQRCGQRVHWKKNSDIGRNKSVVIAECMRTVHIKTVVAVGQVVVVKVPKSSLRSPSFCQLCELLSLIPRPPSIHSSCSFSPHLSPVFLVLFFSLPSRSVRRAQPSTCPFLFSFLSYFFFCWLDLYLSQQLCFFFSFSLHECSDSIFLYGRVLLSAPKLDFLSCAAPLLCSFPRSPVLLSLPSSSHFVVRCFGAWEERFGHHLQQLQHQLSKKTLTPSHMSTIVFHFSFTYFSVPWSLFFSFTDADDRRRPPGCGKAWIFSSNEEPGRDRCTQKKKRTPRCKRERVILVCGKQKNMKVWRKTKKKLKTTTISHLTAKRGERSKHGDT